MGAAEATLKLLLLGEDRSASRVLKGAGNEAERTGSKFGKFAKFGAAAVASGLAAAGAAAVVFAKKSINAYKDVAMEAGALSRVTGLTIKDASRLRFAGEESGVAFAALQKSMQLFGKNLSAAGKTTKTNAAMIKQLGFNYKDAHGKILPMANLLPKVADRFQKMPDGPEKTALAMKLFGRSGADMIKILNKGSEGIKELGEEADRTGNSISNTDAFKKNLQAQREFHASITGLKIQLGQALYPALTAISTALAEHVGPMFTSVLPSIQKFGKWISEKVVPVIRELAGKYLTGLAKGFENFKKHIGELQPYLTLMGKILTNVILPVMGKLFTIVLPAVGIALGLVARALGAVGRAGIWMWNNALQPVFKFLVNAIATALDWIGRMLTALGHVPGFGWAKKMGQDLHNVADQARGVADAIRKIPNNKKINVKLTVGTTVTGPINDLIIAGINSGTIGRTAPKSSPRLASSANRTASSGSTGATNIFNISGAMDSRSVAAQIAALLSDFGYATGVRPGV